MLNSCKWAKILGVCVWMLIDQPNVAQAHVYSIRFQFHLWPVNVWQDQEIRRLAIEIMMGLDPLVWFCRPVAEGVWAREADSSFGAYTPCAIDSVVGNVSQLVLLGLCLYRIWLIEFNPRPKRYRLRSNFYNYMLSVLAVCCAAEPLFRLVMGISIFNLDSETALAPFEVGHRCAASSHYNIITLYAYSFLVLCCFDQYTVDICIRLQCDMTTCFFCRLFIWSLKWSHGLLWFFCCSLKLECMSKNSDGTSDLEYYMF